MTSYQVFFTGSATVAGALTSVLADSTAPTTRRLFRYPLDRPLPTPAPRRG